MEYKFLKRFLVVVGFLGVSPFGELPFSHTSHLFAGCGSLWDLVRFGSKNKLPQPKPRMNLGTRQDVLSVVLYRGDRLRLETLELDDPSFSPIHGWDYSALTSESNQIFLERLFEAVRKARDRPVQLATDEGGVFVLHNESTRVGALILTGVHSHSPDLVAQLVHAASGREIVGGVKFEAKGDPSGKLTPRNSRVFEYREDGTYNNSLGILNENFDLSIHSADTAEPH